MVKYRTVLIPAVLSVIMIICHVLQYENIFHLNQQFGIYPRTWKGISGILFSPFLHGDFMHLANNLWSFFFLTWSLFYAYEKIAWKVFAVGWITTGVWTWIIAQNGYHIGASGIVYFLAFFVFLSGIFQKQKRLLALSLVVCFLHAGLVWGALPVEWLFEKDLWKLSPSQLSQIKRTSWEGHLAGALVGIVYAFYFRKTLPKPTKMIINDEVYIEKMEEIYGKYYWDPEKREKYISNASEPMKIIYNYVPKTKEDE